MGSHSTDWHPGRVSNEFREGWDRIFGDAKDDDAQVKAALKHFGQDCCASGCNCSMKKPE